MGQAQLHYERFVVWAESERLGWPAPAASCSGLRTYYRCSHWAWALQPGISGRYLLRFYLGWAPR